MKSTRNQLRWVAAALLAVTPLHAAVDLQITEMWIGGLEGAEATSDWFELTNFGDMDATGLDGNLYYDDDSDDPTKDDSLVGIDTIAAGESVVYLVSWEDDFVLADAITAFADMWGAPAGDLSELQVGYVDGGSGLGGGSDAVNIFDGNTADAMTIDREMYQGAGDVASFVSDPDGNFNFPTDRAQPGVWGAYEGNLPASDFVDPLTGAAIGNAVGSPGSVVPEPASIGLLLLAAACLCRLRRR